MDNIRAVIGILFTHVSEQDVLEENVAYNNIPFNTFAALANSYITRYSNDEIHNLYNYLKNELKWMRHKVYYEDDDGETAVSINVFDVLYLFSGEVLAEEKGQPVCQYLHLLRWHEMSREVGEDSLITSYLAFNDACFGKKRKNFFWKPVIGHNSQALNRIMEKGVAENHFHLKGSAPLFHVSWISLMNNVVKPEFQKGLEEYDERRLKRNVAYRGGYKEDSLYALYLRAACIRLYLFQRLKGERGDGELLSYIKDSIELLQNLDKVQGLIEYYQGRFNEYDYAICEPELQHNKNHGLNELLAGERWFLYEMFYIIYSRKSHCGDLCQYFYHYLIIKNMIRAEMIQVNENVGFDNFLMYQNRKEQFIDGTKYEPVYVKMAVRDTILNQNIQKLEARIAPKGTALENENYIKKLDTWIAGKDAGYPGGEKEEKELLEKFFYVEHFIKDKDREEERYEYGMCRHFSKRKEIEAKARALAEFRESGSEQAKRIRGIDASSSEISCRPGVFAQAFRYLKYHRAGEDMPQLRCTYHVGEDFLDVIDGLRAIDEAILFLNLKCGDRLGHALALGVDIDEWYQNKANLLLISKMDYLDNLVWVYSKIRKYRLKGCEDAVHYITKRYDELVKEVYKRHISDDSRYSFSIESYYDAWKLRGDNPENYAGGSFRIENAYADEWDYHAINREFPSNYKMRYDSEVAYIYYLFHYNRDVKMAGDEMMEVYVNSSLIYAAKQIQKRMQIEICERGIGIETNPSSNCSIGSFKRYDKHPIRKWYNYGLTSNQKELEECPQLLVSINTDDQGVFNTYLENEYAYLAIALEKLKNEDGTPKYKRTMILRWLDNIRELGMEQSFL